MTTKTPRAPGSLAFSEKNRTRITKKIKIVTLMHGGGPVSSEGDHPSAPTRKPDDVTPIRGSALRGQLRFWWRATHGCTSKTTEELRKREDTLWGNASKPGLVDVAVRSSMTASNVAVDTLGNIGTGLRYGAFATGNLTRLLGEATLEIVVRKPGEKATTASHADLNNEVQDALTAWLLFGGMGGRTRRGFGAVHADGLPKPEAFLERFSQHELLAAVPTLHGATLVVAQAEAPSSEDAHRAAVDKLSKFRQGSGVGRNPGQTANRPGRSRWPEADEIRRIKRTNSAGHDPVHPVKKFPRGVFGLPIVFQFKDNRQGDPQQIQLVPGKVKALDGMLASRMASPLILRPTLIGDKWHAMALRLRVPNITIDRGELAGRNGQPGTPVTIAITADEAQSIRPIADYGGGEDVIAVFLSRF